MNNSSHHKPKIFLLAVFLAAATGTLFQAAAINSSTFSIPIPVISALAFLLLCGLAKADVLLRPKLSKFEASYLKFLFPFLVYSVISALFFPTIFEGLPVFVPKLGLQYVPTGILQFSFSNVAQILYLLFNFFYLLMALRILQAEKGASIALTAFRTLGFVALFFTFYQFFSYQFHLFYPTDIINSNTSFDEGFDQTTGFGFRLSGVFTEPSLNGNFLGSYFVFFLLRSIWSNRYDDAVYAAMFMFATLLVTSSLGYLEITLGILLFLAITVSKVVREKRVKYVSLAFGIFFLFLLFVFSVLFQNDIAYAVLDKSTSGSYLQRSGADSFSYLLFIKTWGLGVGLGSNRPSGLLSYLVSNVGAIGTCLFFAFMFAIVRPAQIIRIGSPDQKAFVCAIFAFLVGKCFGVPDISYQYFWFFLVVGGAQTMAVTSVRRRSATNTPGSGF